MMTPLRQTSLGLSRVPPHKERVTSLRTSAWEAKPLEYHMDKLGTVNPDCEQSREKNAFQNLI